jgi:hypothetical protein
VAGQSHGQWGPEFPGMLQFSLRPGILNYCPGGGTAEYFTSFRRRLHTPFILILCNFAHKYIEIARWWLRGNKVVKRDICSLFVLEVDSSLEDINCSCPRFLCPILLASLRIRPQAGP